MANYATDDLVAALQRLTDNHGADMIYDPVGGTIGSSAVAALAPGGRFELIGYAGNRFRRWTRLNS